MICPICNKEILQTDKKYLWCNDTPYFSIYTHKVCFDRKDNLLGFLMEHSVELQEIFHKQSVNNRK